MSETAAATASAVGARGTLTRNRILLIFGGLVLAILMANLDNSIVNPALPTIVGDLHGLQQMQWVVTGYVLASTIGLPIYGKLGDLLGRKPVVIFAIVVFLAGSMLTGLAQNMTELIAFRALQGVGAGGLLVSAMAIGAEIVSPRERGKYMGIIMAVNSVSTVAGPLLGGLFTDQVSWRWCFYVNVPVGIAALLLIVAALPGGARRRAFRFDVAGATLLAAASAALVFVTSWGGTRYDWTSWQILGLGGVALAAGIGFVLAERRAAEPIIPLRLFRDRTFSLIAAIALVAGFGMFGSIAFLPTFLQTVDDVSATASGLLMLPLMGGIMVAATVAGQIMSATGRYKVFLVLGPAIGAAGMGLLSLMSAITSAFQNGVFMAVTGVGLGLVLSVLVTAVQNAAPREDLGAATSSNNFFRQIGASLGTSVVGAIFTQRLTTLLPGAAGLHIPSVQAITPALAHGLPPALRDTFVHAYATALPPIFLFLVPLFAVAFVLAWFVREIPLRGATAPAPATTAPAVMAAPPVVTITAADPVAARRVAEGIATQLSVPLLDLSAPDALATALEGMLHTNPDARRTLIDLLAGVAAGANPGRDLHRAMLDVATSSGAVILQVGESVDASDSLHVKVA